MVPHESRYAKYADYIGRRRWTNAQLKMEVPPDVIEEMKRAARGEIEIEEGIRNTLRKYTHAKVRGERPLP